MQWLYFKAVSKSSRSSRGPANGRNMWPIFQTSIAFSNHLDLLVHSPLLDLISLDPPELCGGVSFFIFYKVSFLKHSSAQLLRLDISWI